MVPSLELDAVFVSGTEETETDIIYDESPNAIDESSPDRILPFNY